MNSTTENQPQATMQYWGGFMDEALNFSINTGLMPSAKIPDNVMYRPLLALYNRDKRWLEAIQERTVNGFAWTLNGYLAGPSGNQYTEWRLGTGDSVECFRLLQWIRPSLTFKQTQAEIFEKFLQQKREVRRFTQGLTKVPALYSDPFERMGAEESLRQELLQAKSQVISETFVPGKERLAGTIDAGMSLGLYLAENDQYLEFLARGTMTSVRRGLLEALYEKYGGVKLSKRSDTNIAKMQVPTYEWQINGNNLGNLLNDVEPDLVFKKTQARFIIEFLRVRKAVMSTRRFANDPLINTQRSRMLQSFLYEWRNIDPLPR